ncbi:MAG TPA: UbiA family prenyltransferase [Bryobacteraceae bacterium]|nr:UbiA family prenyltransferase [Bryobacteraceae bacterium]
MTPLPSPTSSISLSERIKAHVAIARVDHWTKNVFVLPGIAIPLAVQSQPMDWQLLQRLLLGMLSVCLIASSNYVINEVLDAPFDRLHPVKRNRPAAVGLVSIPAAYVQWLLLMAIGMALALAVSKFLAVTMAALWIMGCVYNIRPLRTKDLPYLDVLSESVNNPIRMLAGWYMVTDQLIPPVSILISYWMVGCYFMALKRFSELRQIGDKDTAAAYRRSFHYYSEQSLLVSVLFYASAGMLFFGAFLIRYRIELVLAFPLIAVVMAVYFHLAFEPNSAVQNPEYLYKQKALMISVISCSVLLLVLAWVDIPFLRSVFVPTLPNR